VITTILDRACFADTTLPGHNHRTMPHHVAQSYRPTATPCRVATARDGATPFRQRRAAWQWCAMARRRFGNAVPRGNGVRWRDAVSGSPCGVAMVCDGATP
jgi:hypothetical protein